jgi:GNAT superfamily N-acetyltransferase
MMGGFSVPQIRDYRVADEASWLRCRVLSFLDTCYYDDVATAKPVEDDADATIELVAVDGDSVIGLMDVAIRAELATIECVAVHPDHQRAGVASALLSTALGRLAGTSATVLDAWTREDSAALAWYASWEFVEARTYLHVYSGYNHAVEMVSGILPLKPVSVFAHAAREHEAQMRAEFERVYICRRMQRPLP